MIIERTREETQYTLKVELYTKHENFSDKNSYVCIKTSKTTPNQTMDGIFIAIKTLNQLSN